MEITGSLCRYAVRLLACLLASHAFLLAVPQHSTSIYHVTKKIELPPKPEDIPSMIQVGGYVEQSLGCHRSFIRSISRNSLLSCQVQFLSSGQQIPDECELRNLLAVRQQKVVEALEWLCKHNPVYQRHCSISRENAACYAQNDVPRALYRCIATIDS